MYEPYEFALNNRSQAKHMKKNIKAVLESDGMFQAVNPYSSSINEKMDEAIIQTFCTKPVPQDIMPMKDSCLAIAAFKLFPLF
jgi:hypothetical protein